MPKLRIRFVGTDIHRDVEVDEQTAEYVAGQLGDRDAVLRFGDDHSTHLVPVRNITYVTATSR
ncbi:hypothetical protein [Actinoplanes aureus]|uniref:Uncharacterized protein n=1 Tax=Actinoplanes aureus TaxID=2792083 RepID=A0A931FYL6_9ACTN|nr:hypothetical protein [Actinoplanes aureus]MBG0563730.1 hypothetical protein [Actinoplanes aureus]